MITFKEYADKNSITYEAVRQQVARYSEELEGHIIRKGRVQFLDEEAVAFLNEHRSPLPAAVYRDDPRIAELELKLKKAEEGAKELWKQLKLKDATIDKLVDQTQQLQLKADKVQQLEAAASIQKADLENLQAELQVEKSRRIPFKEYLKRRKGE